MAFGYPTDQIADFCRGSLSFISYYIPQYKKFAENGKLYGGYGPRLINWDGRNQLKNVIALLKHKQSSRRAVIQLFDRNDLIGEHEDIPCTCTLQFMIRQGQLYMVTNMRSNDVYLGLPHDIFCFTMIQEILARTLSLELGKYKHFVSSLHLYKRSFTNARRFLDEGWQATTADMPEMPIGDPWPAINSLLKAEHELRVNNSHDFEGTDELAPYWTDLIRILEVFNYTKSKDEQAIERLRKEMWSPVYDTYISAKLNRIS